MFRKNDQLNNDTVCKLSAPVFFLNLSDNYRGAVKKDIGEKRPGLLSLPEELPSAAVVPPQSSSSLSQEIRYGRKGGSGAVVNISSSLTSPPPPQPGEFLVIICCQNWERAEREEEPRQPHFRERETVAAKKEEMEEKSIGPLHHFSPTTNLLLQPHHPHHLVSFSFSQSAASKHLQCPKNVCSKKVKERERTYRYIILSPR